MQHTERSRAKVNLSLRILGKRDDGFHELVTRMAPLELADQLHFEKAEGYSLHCEVEGVPLDESNLVTKAVRLFEKELGREVAWSITIEKVIPHGAGLAGGSSNAAAALRALNQLEGAGFSNKQLAEMAAVIGSDCAFFIYDQVCDCAGRGEKVSPVEFSGEATLVLLKPSFGVSTPTAFKAWKDAREIPGVSYAPQQTSLGELVNELERPVFQKHRFLAETKTWLLAQPEVKAGMMSGSGSTMYAIVENKLAGQAIVRRALADLDPTLWSWVGRIASEEAMIDLS